MHLNSGWLRFPAALIGIASLAVLALGVSFAQAATITACVQQTQTAKHRPKATIRLLPPTASATLTSAN